MYKPSAGISVCILLVDIVQKLLPSEVCSHTLAFWDWQTC